MNYYDTHDRDLNHLTWWMFIQLWMEKTPQEGTIWFLQVLYHRQKLHKLDEREFVQCVGEKTADLHRSRISAWKRQEFKKISFGVFHLFEVKTRVDYIRGTRFDKCGHATDVRTRNNREAEKHVEFSKDLHIVKYISITQSEKPVPRISLGDTQIEGVSFINATA